MLPTVIIYTKIYINSLLSKAVGTGICQAYSLILRFGVFATSVVVVGGGGKFRHAVRTDSVKVRPHRTRSAAADCGLSPLRNVTF